MTREEIAAKHRKMRCFTIRNDKDGREAPYYMHFGPKNWVKLFRMSPVVEVDLEIIPDDEAVETDHYGFYNFKDDGIIPVEEGLGSIPAIYHARVLLDVHYAGVQKEIDRGRGKVVRVRVTEVEKEVSDGHNA